MSNYAIYRPSGKAQEYAEWACNFYVGCSNNCSYCYLKKGIGCKTLGGNVPMLKKCFKDEEHALKAFEKEMKYNMNELRKHGIFFSFTTDPMLPETLDLTLNSLAYCMAYDIPVKILTKVTGDWVDYLIELSSRKISINGIGQKMKGLIAFGFTLTNHDELEPGASTNQERIEAMKKLHNAGFKTFASIEPIIDFESSWNMIFQSVNYCDLFKIGLMSGEKYKANEIWDFFWGITKRVDKPIYWKDSLIKKAGIMRESMPDNCVDRDYNIFQN